jgi:hypothetical protein
LNFELGLCQGGIYQALAAAQGAVMKRQAEVFQLWILKRRPCFKMQSIFCFDLANFRNVLGAK